VRDALAGGHPVDWDIATSARPGAVRKLFRRTVPIGIEHGTVGVLGRSGKMYEVTTFRRDVETFGRKARVVFADSLEEDLDRRDFTINAVAWRPRTGELSDPHGGEADLAHGLLRTVGDPEERFAEDRLRVLRALRFAGRFGLLIEEETREAIEGSADQLGDLSAERIREELWKVLAGSRRPSTTLRLYAETGVLGSLYPELDGCRGVPVRGASMDVWTDVLRAVDSVSTAHPLVRLTALLHRLGAEGGEAALLADPTEAARSAALARELLRRLRSSNAEIETVTHLIAQHATVPAPDSSDPELRSWLRRVGRDYVNDMFRLLFAICRAGGELVREAIEVRELYDRVRLQLEAKLPLTVQELAIGGDDLRHLGIPPGPIYGQLLNRLLDLVMEEPELNQRDRLIEMVLAELGEAGARGVSNQTE
jgi:tRNA nucleotidyltransferase (CCA-adding enzyme)